MFVIAGVGLIGAVAVVGWVSEVLRSSTSFDCGPAVGEQVLRDASMDVSGLTVLEACDGEYVSLRSEHSGP